MLPDFGILLKNDLDAIKRTFNIGNINQVNSEGYTPLYYCCMKSDVSLKTITELVRIGAGIDVKGEDNETPLFISTFQNREDVVQYLLNSGAAIDVPNSTRKDTVLHIASRLGYENLVQLFIKKGANLNARNAALETPAFAAAKHGRHNVIYHLILAGANFKLCNEDGKDPLYIASEKKHKNVIVLLKASKDELKHAKAAGDAELKVAPTSIPTSEEIVERMKTDKTFQAKMRAQKVAPIEQQNPEKKSEIIEIHVPKPKVRTYDPFSGQMYGPCKSIEEVGFGEAPAVPNSLQNRPPSQAQRIGGTIMMVETEDGPRKPIQIDELGGDGEVSIYLTSTFN